VKANLFTDGGARGNPGPAAFGFVLAAENGDVLAAEGVAIGEATNNVAEYSGLIAGMTHAFEADVTDLAVHCDSELVIKQMLGVYRVKNEALRALNEEAGRIARMFARVEFIHIPREQNELADRLVNDALDAQTAG
jgi:ribonuclease HI